MKWRLRFKLWYLRVWGRRLYTNLSTCYDAVDCSGSILEYMNPRIKHMRKKLQVIVRLIKRLDAES